LQPLLRIIGHHSPELAGRLERLWRRSPERCHEVLMDALVFRLEEKLDEAERDLRHDEPRPPGERESPRPPHRGPDAPPREMMERHMRLEREHEECERVSHELAERLRHLQHEGGPAEARMETREELERVVNHQFEVRTQLRRFELERIERELSHLREVVERMQRQFERRERERGAIIERRIKQLLHDDMSDW
jgi:hypothetical protein